jgi:N,N'-diacetyllegionaminate synthase
MKGTLIIAEAGVNHNGDMNLAKKMVDVAAVAGADYVKFQTFKAEKIVSPLARKADYQIMNMSDASGDSQFEMLKQLELNEADHHELIRYCALKNIKFLSTAFDLESVDLLHSMGISLFKVPSGEITNLPYLRKIGGLGKKIILSTGMCTMQEVGAAINALRKAGAEKNSITVLHCTTEYPTSMEDVNLKAMASIQREFNVSVGYSDHTLGIEVPVAAVALGATVIEKHFTLDRSMNGPDHKASLEPDELKAMVVAIRNIEKALSGNGEKQPGVSEAKNKSIARKSIHLAKDMKHGDTIFAESIIALRPGDGISPMEWDEVVGKILKRDLTAGTKLSWQDLA